MPQYVMASTPSGGAKRRVLLATAYTKSGAKGKPRFDKRSAPYVSMGRCYIDAQSPEAHIFTMRPC